jgi:hypothetical protein
MTIADQAERLWDLIEPVRLHERDPEAAVGRQPKDPIEGCGVGLEVFQQRSADVSRCPTATERNQRASARERTPPAGGARTPTSLSGGREGPGNLVHSQAPSANRSVLV